MGQTIVETIAQTHLAEGPKRLLRPGDFVAIRPHRVMTHDNTSAVMKKFQSIGAKKIHNPRQLVFALDHDIQNKEDSNLHKYQAIEGFAKYHGADMLCPDLLWLRPIRTPICTGRWARWGRRLCALTRPQRGRRAISGGRFHDQW